MIVTAPRVTVATLGGQPADPDLDTLATPLAAGLLESTGSAYTSRPIGVGAGTSIPTKTDVDTLVAVETSARATAVTAEASTRASADTTLSTSISSEASARTSADSTEVTARITGDAASVSTAAADATSKVATETTARTSADSTEASARIAGDAASVSTAASDATTKANAAQAASQPLSANLTTLSAVTPGIQGQVTLAEAAAVVDPASPYTVAARVRKITTGASLTVNLPSSSIAVGEEVSVTNSSASSIIITFARSASDTIDATTSVAVTLAAHAKCAAVRRASADWRSVQPVAASGISPDASEVPSWQELFPEAYGPDLTTPVVVESPAWSA